MENILIPVKLFFALNTSLSSGLVSNIFYCSTSLQNCLNKNIKIVKFVEHDTL